MTQQQLFNKIAELATMFKLSASNNATPSSTEVKTSPLWTARPGTPAGNRIASSMVSAGADTSGVQSYATDTTNTKTPLGNLKTIRNFAVGTKGTMGTREEISKSNTGGFSADTFKGSVPDSTMSKYIQSKPVIRTK